MMIERIRVHEFLKTGRLCEFQEINYGMTRQNLQLLLGKTKWVHYTNKQYRFPSIYKYGLVEFYFEEGKDGRLMGFQILPRSVETPRLNLEIDYGLLQEVTTLSDIKEALEKHSISFEEIEHEWDSSDTKRFLTKGKVELIFTKNYEADAMYLQKCSKFIQFKKQVQRTKQMSIVVSSEEYEKLKKISQESKISIAKICSAMITEKLQDLER